MNGHDRGGALKFCQRFFLSRVVHEGIEIQIKAVQIVLRVVGCWSIFLPR
jgi:hypothetical protein